METILSHRLQAVATYIPRDSRLLDVGSDHAYLPIALMTEGMLHFAIAGEVVNGPYQSALDNVCKAQLSDKISVRLADGLAAFTAEDDISVISICGMGGRLIADILEKGKEKLTTIKRLVLQPNNREDELRQWLMTNGFCIVAETILAENEKYYEILVAEHGSQRLDDESLRFGPYLSAEQSPVFYEKWQKEKAKLADALNRVPINHDMARTTLEEKIQQIEKVLMK